MNTKLFASLSLSIAVASASVGSTHAQSQGLGNSLYFPNLPNVLTRPMTRPRANLQIPVIEPFVKDEQSGLTFVYDPAKVTAKDLKYARVEAYNPANVFPGVAKDVFGRPAGGPVPILNYTDSMIVADSCRFVLAQRPWLHTPTLHWTDGAPIAWFDIPERMYQQGDAFGSPYTYREEQPPDELLYYNLCAVQYAVDGAASHLAFFEHFHPGRQHLDSVYPFALQLARRMRFEGGVATSVGASNERSVSVSPYVFSRSAADPLFAVIGVAPGQRWLYYDEGRSSFVIPVFLLTLDPSNLCTILPDSKGAPGMICGFDPDNPPMFLMYLTAVNFGSTPAVTSFPLGLANSTGGAHIVFNGFRYVSPAAGHHEGMLFNRRQVLESAYPHYYLALAMKTDDARKFIREHVGRKFVESYRGALLSLRAQTVAATGAAETSLPKDLSAEQRWRVYSSAHNLALTPYAQGSVQSVRLDFSPQKSASWLAFSFDVAAATQITRVVGRDYFVVSGTTNGFMVLDLKGKTIVSATHVLDFANSAVYRVDEAGNCVAVRHSSLDPQLVRPSFIADFRTWQLPRVRYPRAVSSLPLELTISREPGDGVSVRFVNTIDYRGQLPVPSVDEFSLRALPGKGVVEFSGKDAFTIRFESPASTRYSLTSKASLAAEDRLVADCRAGLSKQFVPMRELVTGVLTRADARVQFEAFNENAGVLYFVGTADEWREALRADYASTPNKFVYRTKDGRELFVEQTSALNGYDGKGSKRPIQVFLVR